MENIFRYLRDEHSKKLGRDLENVESWQLLNKVNGTPRQHNGYDCGIFAILYADYLSEDLPLHFSQHDTASFRIKICHSIRTGHLWYEPRLVQVLL